MRMLLNVKIPHEPFNSFVREGSVGTKLMKVLEAIKPEAIYFTEQDGLRGAVVVVEIAHASKIPMLAEPWFLVFNAEVECRIAMIPDDLMKAGLDKLGKQWG